MSKYKEHFEKINEFKKELDDEKGINDNDKNVILQAFADNLFRGVFLTSSKQPEEILQQPINQRSFALSNSQTFAGFINKTKFNQHPDIVLLAIYYLAKCKTYTGVTVSEIEEQYRSALIKKSSNTRMFINVNKKRGYIMDVEPKDDKTAWMITRDGLNYIEEVLKNGNKE